ncbi:MAG: histidine--tRNA ligase [Patescibacteria group bacterium]
MSKDSPKLSREPYKGTRDFYPEEMAFQKWLFEKMRRVCESYGYVEYGASPLEPAELYTAKTGEEIVNEQTYTFEDRGGRKVTLRPEMTPTVARMIAARRRELPFPLRWYSIPNIFRYEQPQRGRLREHYQLNVDLFGIKGIEADIEIISIAYNIMKAFGAKDEDFEIRINNRKYLQSFFKKLHIGAETSKNITRLIDKKDKIDKKEFEKRLSEIVPEHAKKILGYLAPKPEGGILPDDYKIDPSDIPSNEQVEAVADISNLLNTSDQKGIRNIVHDLALTRGFDYYTGTIFEVFDTSGENKRSLFGGGRYDELLDIFDEEKIPAVGFGMGDVTVRNFLETHKLLPKLESTTKVSLCLMQGVSPEFVNESAKLLRESGINTSIDWSGRKIGDQIKSADKSKIPYIMVIGENEMKTNTFTLKNLAAGEENKGNVSELVELIKKARS